MKNIKVTIGFLLIFAMLALSGCSTSKDSTASNQVNSKDSGVINLYTDRHYDTDQELFDLFAKETGIKVNVVKAESDELIERLAREDKDTKADLLITADAGRLYRAKEKGLLQPASSETLFKNIPENLRDKDNEWFGLTVRARVIVYSKDRVNTSQLSTYEDLTDPKWKGKILVRSSNNIYNQSLLASFIALNGEDKAKEWAKGLVANMAREPKGNDRDQAKAIVAGEGDIAIMNTYYIGKMLKSSDPEEVKVAEKVGVFFPNQDTSGTHINVSGVGLVKYAKNKENAIKLMEFLSGEKAQKQFAEANFEYPVNPNVEPSELLKSWGDFKSQNINLTLLGEYNQKAVKIFNEVGWK
ncbi:Fe(3+) ABC transporter substrate-binding protein [Desulforamulus hydrothermalis]|uniref:Iron uptake protein A1 n=1 Tax=Desulforamulus hydrothermalis Lam5 = DSM 18033 TaxID=1121428 RepID=K8DYV1_9FIRM|nr:Fe(3+) ABC transporter substrate-binding protein [Desulforamulus hydrothermalis]CCO08142.1 Iron uptake protein A1 [Desulforamulus hydrothermalis Lam5 = DSM 18033]SHH48320.1 iron(III) transport system substrate-binding protein [Desulforamulus hydrothermalis Lam5 = DSM 18033]